MSGITTGGVARKGVDVIFTTAAEEPDDEGSDEDPGQEGEDGDEQELAVLVERGQIIPKGEEDGSVYEADADENGSGCYLSWRRMKDRRVRKMSRPTASMTNQKAFICDPSRARP